MTEKELNKRIAYLEAVISSILWQGAHIWPSEWGREFDSKVAKRYKINSNARKKK